MVWKTSSVAVYSRTDTQVITQGFVPAPAGGESEQLDCWWASFRSACSLPPLTWSSCWQQACSLKLELYTVNLRASNTGNVCNSHAWPYTNPEHLTAACALVRAWSRPIRGSLIWASFLFLFVDWQLLFFYFPNVGKLRVSCCRLCSLHSCSLFIPLWSGIPSTF